MPPAAGTLQSRIFPVLPPALRWLTGMMLLCLLFVSPVRAELPLLGSLPSEPIGRWMGYLVEQDAPLSLIEAQAISDKRGFQQIRSDVPKFGIGARPVWLHLPMVNGESLPAKRRLQIETAWLDRIDVYHLHEGQLLAQWRAGDAEAGEQHPRAGLGYLFDLELPPGRNDLYLRIETPDPLVVPVRLLDAASAEALQSQHDRGYGLLYGCLLALIAYNAMLFIGLRERGYFEYTLYVASFVLLHLAYTGHAYAWLWPGQAAFQQFAIPLSMALTGSIGLRFASGFLDLRQHAPLAHRAVYTLIPCGVVPVVTATLLQNQALAVLFSFIFIMLFSVVMVWLGVITVRHGQVAGAYFLAAVLAAMLGTATTAMAVWLGIPYTSITFHAAGWGVVIEGILLALGLAYRMRQHQAARREAEQLARIDPLTGLLNRRAFFEHALPIWSAAQRQQRPLALMMVDIDHFKLINDEHGHAVGDRALVAIAGLLVEACRSSDIAARWGGEEFIVLLAETDAPQAARMAERLRREIESLALCTALGESRLSASFGIAELSDHELLEDLINEADGWLYRAKQAGRNRVAGTQLQAN